MIARQVTSERETMRTRGRWAVFAAVLAAVTLAAAGCGGDDESSSGETTIAAETTEPATTEESTTAEETTEATTEETTEAAATGIADKDCLELAGIGAKFSEALGATGQNANYAATTKLFQELVAKAPDEIKDDLATVAKAWGEMAKGLEGMNLSSGQVPSAATIAKLQALGAKFNTPEIQQASKNLTAWSNEHCGTGTP
jgi:hypothetical protein